MDPLPELLRQKADLRRQAEQRRRDQPDKDAISAAIVARFADLSEYQAAPTVMLYVHVRDEVRTHDLIATALAQGKRVVTPYCVDRDLELFHLENLSELAIGYYGLLEPRSELRALPGKRIAIQQVDLVMTPGVAFDRQGGRLGHGKGFYDRLLARARPDTPRIAVAFECQLFPQVPMADYDVPVDKVVTELAAYPGRGREAGRA